MNTKMIAAVAVVAVIAIAGVALVLGNNPSEDPGTPAAGEVVYNGNGGIYNGQTTIKSTMDSASPCLFIYEGYDFMAWNTKADGTGTKYLPHAAIDKSKGLTLYAQWTKDTGMNITGFGTNISSVGDPDLNKDISIVITGKDGKTSGPINVSSLPYEGVGVVTVVINNATDLVWDESEGMFKFTHSGIGYYMKISADGEKEVSNTVGKGIANHAFITDGDTYLYLNVGIMR